MTNVELIGSDAKSFDFGILNKISMVEMAILTNILFVNRQDFMKVEIRAWQSFWNEMENEKDKQKE